MSKLTDKIELLSWLRFKTYNLPVAEFCKSVLNDFSMFLVFTFAGLSTLAMFNKNVSVSDVWFKTASASAATLICTLLAVRLTLKIFYLYKTDALKTTIIFVMRFIISTALIVYSGSDMTMNSSSLTFGLAVLSYLFIILFIKIVTNLDRIIQKRLYDFSRVLDNLSELKTEDFIADKYKSYDFKIARQSRSNIIYDLESFGQRESYIKYELDLTVYDPKLKMNYFLDPVVRLA